MFRLWLTAQSKIIHIDDSLVEAAKKNYQEQMNSKKEPQKSLPTAFDDVFRLADSKKLFTPMITEVEAFYTEDDILAIVAMTPALAEKFETESNSTKHMAVIQLPKNDFGINYVGIDSSALKFIKPDGTTYKTENSEDAKTLAQDVLDTVEELSSEAIK